MQKLFAITAIGPDRAGIVRDLSRTIADCGGNIHESRMSALGSEFAVLMLVAGNWHTAGKLRASLEDLEKNSQLTISVRETEARGPQKSAPYSIDVVALDQEGIVLGISDFFARRQLDIAEMSTRSYNAPHTGAAMFGVQLTVNIPADIHVATLRDEFLEYCDAQNLDAIMEPAQR